MFYKVARYNIPIYNGYCKIAVPIGAEPVGVLADTVTTVGETPLFVCINECIDPDNKEVETEELEFLVVGDGTPYGSAKEDDKTFIYLGHVSWDSGYRIHHIFQVVPDDDFDMDFTVAPAFDVEQFIDTLEEGPDGELEPEETDESIDDSVEE